MCRAKCSPQRSSAFRLSARAASHRPGGAFAYVLEGAVRSKLDDRSREDLPPRRKLRRPAGRYVMRENTSQTERAARTVSASRETFEACSQGR
jgi:hypothetical protein